MKISYASEVPFPAKRFPYWHPHFHWSNIRFRFGKHPQVRRTQAVDIRTLALNNNGDFWIRMGIELEAPANWYLKSELSNSICIVLFQGNVLNSVGFLCVGYDYCSTIRGLFDCDGMVSYMVWNGRGFCFGVAKRRLTMCQSNPLRYDRKA